MKKLILKSILYIFLILLFVEVTIRILHLYTEDPPRFIDDFGVEKRVPGHTGYSVTGNRNQNYSKFSINKSGFNSYREFTPTASKFEIALVGDSFIEGFHQDFDTSTGKKIEEQLPNKEVYEYGYAGYDFSNQIHLINAYKKDFDLIDEIVVYLNYEYDLDRGTYEPDYDRIKMLSSTTFKIRDNIKILAYGSKIGILEPLKRLVSGKPIEDEEQDFKNIDEKTSDEAEQRTIDLQRIENFKSLIGLFGFDKTKTALLLDSRKTSQLFLDYCDQNNIDIIDFGENFKNSKKPPTLIYDEHWNNHGRDLIALSISNYVKTKRHLN